MSGSDSGEKSEKATPKRMKEVRKDGSLQKSQDLSSWLGIGAAAVMLPTVLTNASGAAVEQLTQVRDVIANPDPLILVDLRGSGKTTRSGSWESVSLASIVPDVSRPRHKERS